MTCCCCAPGCSECVGCAPCNNSLCGGCLTGCTVCAGPVAGSGAAICCAGSVADGSVAGQATALDCKCPCSPCSCGTTDQPPCCCKCKCNCYCCCCCKKRGNAGSGGSGSSSGGGKPSAQPAAIATCALSKLSNAMNKFGSGITGLLGGPRRVPAGEVLPGQAVPPTTNPISSNSYIFAVIIIGALLLLIAFGHKPEGD